jgi:hypothetical protein
MQFTCNYGTYKEKSIENILIHKAEDITNNIIETTSDETERCLLKIVKVEGDCRGHALNLVDKSEKVKFIIYNSCDHLILVGLDRNGKEFLIYHSDLDACATIDIILFIKQLTGEDYTADDFKMYRSLKMKFKTGKFENKISHVKLNHTNYFIFKILDRFLLRCNFDLANGQIIFPTICLMAENAASPEDFKTIIHDAHDAMKFVFEITGLSLVGDTNLKFLIR